jgi:hypothetical protein
MVNTSFAFDFDKVSRLKGSAAKSIKVHHKYGAHIFKKLPARFTSPNKPPKSFRCAYCACIENFTISATGVQWTLRAF